MRVLARGTAAGQRHREQIGDRIFGHRHPGKRPAQLGEAVVGDGADEFDDPAEVVVDRRLRQPDRGGDGSCLDRGRSLLGQQPDRGLNQPLRYAAARCHV